MKATIVGSPQQVHSQIPSPILYIILRLCALLPFLLKKPPELYLIIEHFVVLIFVGTTLIAPLLAFVGVSFSPLLGFAESLNISGDFHLTQDSFPPIIAQVTLVYTIAAALFEKIFKTNIRISKILLLKFSLSLHIIAFITGMFYGGFGFAWIFILFGLSSLFFFGVWVALNVMQKSIEIAYNTRLPESDIDVTR